ncbi:MAG: hypothetical protein JWM87_2637 [Candidatus Eremiobacteraeota bacterium]|nr:hypothetical protein [Candidatus Eremiobacteraeota bacterium]
MAIATGKPEKDALTVARDIAAVAAIYLLFAGYVYNFYFSERLGIPKAADAPIYAVVASAWTVVAWNHWWFIVAAVLVAAGATVSTRLPAASAAKPWVAPAAAVLFATLALAAFPLIFIAAHATGNAVATETLQGRWLKPAHFRFKPGIAAVYSGIERADSRNALRLIATTPQAVYVLQVSNDTLNPSIVAAIKWDLINSYYSVGD